MTAISTPAAQLDSPAPSWSDRAGIRAALFEARDGITAAILRRAGATGTMHNEVAVSPGAPPFIFALEKPVRPRTWWKRRAFEAAQRRRRHLLVTADLFDAAWYRERYPDVASVGMDALTHFLAHGSFEGRSPGPQFDAMAYLARYPDVVGEGLEPWLHYVLHGRAEGRSHA